MLFFRGCTAGAAVLVVPLTAFVVVVDCLLTYSQVPLLFSNTRFPSDVVAYWFCAYNANDARLIIRVNRNFIMVGLTINIQVNSSNIMIFNILYRITIVPPFN